MTSDPAQQRSHPPRRPHRQPRPPLEAMMLIALWALSIVAAVVIVGTDPEKGADRRASMPESPPMLHAPSRMSTR